MFNKDNSIFLDTKNITWKEVVHQGVDLLVKNNKATSELADAIFQSTANNGCYWVLEKGIALAHAPVGDYNKNPGVSLVLLPYNIQFNNEDKWAKIIITLSATDATSHMEFIKEFGQVFTNDHLKSKLLEAKTLEEFLKIYKAEKGGVNGH